MSDHIDPRPEDFETIPGYLDARRSYLKDQMSLWPSKSQKHRNAAARLHEIDLMLGADLEQPLTQNAS